MSVHTTMARAGSAVRNALSFAHLSGIGASASEDEDEKKKKDARAEDDKKDDKKASGDDNDDKKDDKKASDDDNDDKKKEASADDDKDDKKASDDDNDDKKKEASDDDEDGEGKKKEATEDDDEEEMRGKGALAKARRRERARCAAIFADKAAGRNPQLAANLAFNTSLPRKEALAVLRGTPAPASANAAARASGNPRLGPGGQAMVTETQAIQSRWDSAFAKAGAGTRRKTP